MFQWNSIVRLQFTELCFVTNDQTGERNRPAVLLKYKLDFWAQFLETRLVAAIGQLPRPSPSVPPQGSVWGSRDSPRPRTLPRRSCLVSTRSCGRYCPPWCWWCPSFCTDLTRLCSCETCKMHVSKYKEFKCVNFSPFLKHFSELEQVSFTARDRFKQRYDFFAESVRSTGAGITKQNQSNTGSV